MVTIAFKATEELDEFIRQEAAARKTSVSAFIRRAIEAVRPKRGCKIIRRAGHAAVYLPPGCRPITDADLAAEEEEYVQNL